MSEIEEFSDARVAWERQVEIERLTAENKRLKDALRLYDNPDNWEITWDSEFYQWRDSWNGPPVGNNDSGRSVARAALRECNRLRFAEPAAPAEARASEPAPLNRAPEHEEDISCLETTVKRLESKNRELLEHIETDNQLIRDLVADRQDAMKENARIRKEMESWGFSVDQ